MGHRPAGLGRVFLQHRKPGRFSPKSYMMFFKAGGTYTTLTPQQQRVKAAGIKCGQEMRGVKDVYRRREIAGSCIRGEFGYARTAAAARRATASEYYEVN